MGFFDPNETDKFLRDAKSSLLRCKNLGTLTKLGQENVQRCIGLIEDVLDQKP